jgi:ribosomal protein L15E
VRWLERSINSGYKDFDYIRVDPDFDNIRNHPKYIELVEGGSHDVDLPEAAEEATAGVSE